MSTGCFYSQSRASSSPRSSPARPSASCSTACWTARAQGLIDFLGAEFTETPIRHGGPARHLISRQCGPAWVMSFRAFRAACGARRMPDRLKSGRFFLIKRFRLIRNRPTPRKEPLVGLRTPPSRIQGRASLDRRPDSPPSSLSRRSRLGRERLLEHPAGAEAGRLRRGVVLRDKAR